MAKKIVTFIAVQQNSTTLNVDLNTAKGTVESKNCTTIQNNAVVSHQNHTYWKLLKSEKTEFLSHL